MLRRRICVWATIAAVIANDLPLQLVQAGDWPWDRRHGPETAVTELAEQIDELEQHIDRYGTIVAKAPDVWGQARLTKYRRDYETQMLAELKEFKVRLNGAISRSDQAFLASAMSMQAAVSGRSAFTRIPNSTSETETLQRIDPPAALDPTKLVGDPNAGIIARNSVRTTTLGNFGVDAPNIGLEPTIELDQLSRYLNHLNELRRINDGDDSADAPGYAMHLVRLPISVLPGEETREGYGAEVTVMARPNLHDDLLPQTFRQLVINDLVDQLAFPLAKFLDSKESTELFAQLKEYLDKHTPEYEEQFCQLLTSVNDFEAQLATLRGKQITAVQLAQLRATFDGLLSAAVSLTVITEAEKEELLKPLPGNLLAALQDRDFGDVTNELNALRSGGMTSAYAAVSPGAFDEGKYNQVIDEGRQYLESARSDLDDSMSRFSDQVSEFESRMNEVLESTGIAIPSVAATPSRRAQLPFPPSHILDVYGQIEFLVVAKLASALRKDEHNSKAVLLLDMQKFLAEEFNAARELLDQSPELWTYCHSEVASAVRKDDKSRIAELRTNFLCSVTPRALVHEHSAAMAWMIIVESALLDERLKEDIHDLALAKNSMHIDEVALQCLRFCDPNPTQDARETFNEYVEARWPIHVVAVDPITQDQNIADTFSQRREMQLALAVAMSSGRIGANTFTRMARRLELDMETIALNRTVVGFSHGDDTFGWRFYPRFQSPDTGGHLQTYAVDMFKGLSRDRYIKSSRLEPGIRELTAIIIMPSFVPYVTFDVRANWFELTDPSAKVLTLQDSMDLSADIMRLRQLSATCVQDAHLYRADDLNRMERTVTALERRLPMQTSIIQMPFENSLGGFEFFNTGVPDLAPELKGFYGEPGIRVKAATDAASPGGGATPTAGTNATATASIPLNININGAAATVTPPPSGGSSGGTPAAKTSIFLVGDHFSVHETEVIVGNRRILKDDYQLLSRQIMRVDVPETVLTSADGKFVDIHVATPYGISNHLLVPVFEEKKKEEPKPGESAASAPFRFNVTPAEITGCLCYAGTCGTCTSLMCLSDLSCTIKPICPCACCPSLEYAAFVTVKDAKGVAKLERAPMQCIPLSLEQCQRDALCKGQEVTLKLSDADKAALQNSVSCAISKLCKTSAAAVIELDGCIRVTTTQNGTGVQNYVKIPVITIKVSECPESTTKCSTCSPSGAAMLSVPAPVLFAPDIAGQTVR